MYQTLYIQCSCIRLGVTTASLKCILTLLQHSLAGRLSVCMSLAGRMPVFGQESVCQRIPK
jgi:hypothetical protein